jgi:uncharacterized repeat protein (TIGR03803 family)
MNNSCRIAILILASLLTTLGHSQTVKQVLSFSDAFASGGGLATPAQGRDGRLYVTTNGQGSNQNPDGTVFRIDADGSSPTVLFSFSGTNGYQPRFGLTLGIDGDYYGTTLEGGVANSGVLFKVAPTGAYTSLYEFSGGADGFYPAGSPVQAPDGNWYGATILGTGSSGTVYKYVPSTGTFTTILSLSADGSQGSGIFAPIIQASDNSLYGIAVQGGANNCGTIFRLNTAGVLLHVYSFPCGAGGFSPAGALYQAADGSLYGTTQGGGNITRTGPCAKVGCGTVFKVSHGAVSILYRFAGEPYDGRVPVAGLVQGTDGNLYAGTESGGSYNFGTLYQISTSGQYKLLYSFVSSVGVGADSALMQHTNGKFYGITSALAPGAMYSLDMGLGPFIALVRYTGFVGRSVQILGQGLKGATAVTVNGVPATSFKIVSDFYMTAVIPAGATTGPVVVTTSTGTLTSNHNLRIVK